MRTRCLAVIPARIGSTRFPGKLLADLAGSPVIAHTVRAVLQAHAVDELVVATDDTRIAEAAREEGARAILTDPALPSGTHRVAAAVEEYVPRPERAHTLVVNVQGDEPLISPRHIDQLVALAGSGGCDVATLATRVRSWEELRDENVVKCVRNSAGLALLFSRAPVPHVKGGSELDSELHVGLHLRHLVRCPRSRLLLHLHRYVLLTRVSQGIYAFTAATLLNKLMPLPTSELSSMECLEQLQWLDHGARIRVGTVESAYGGVDVKGNLEALRLHFRITH